MSSEGCLLFPPLSQWVRTPIVGQVQGLHSNIISHHTPRFLGVLCSLFKILPFKMGKLLSNFTQIIEIKVKLPCYPIKQMSRAQEGGGERL